MLAVEVGLDLNGDALRKVSLIATPISPRVGVPMSLAHDEPRARRANAIGATGKTLQRFPPEACGSLRMSRASGIR